MGYFTWTFANKEIKETKYGYASSCTLGYGYRGYIALPKGCNITGKNVVENKEGYKFIKDDYYDGYGMFGSFDAYDVVVDINKGHLAEAVEKIAGKHSFRDSQDAIYLQLARMYDAAASEDELEKLFEESKVSPYGRWKRNLGIYLSCYKCDNELLKYPLKIVSSTRCKYEELPCSDSTQ